MVERKWIFHSKANPDREYLALATYLPLKHIWKIPSFFRMVGAIQNQLGESEGLIGYSMIAKILRKRFWTLSVWEDENALSEFVKEVPHRNIMGSLRGQLTGQKFVQWKIGGASVPPTWQEAFKQLLKE